MNPYASGFRPVCAITTTPYTIEDQLADSLGINTFSTSEKGQTCFEEVLSAIQKGSRKFIIHLQDNNFAEYAKAIQCSWRRNELYIELQFDQNYFSQSTPDQIKNQLFHIFQTLNVGCVDRIKFPKGMREIANPIADELIRLKYVKQAIIQA